MFPAMRYALLFLGAGLLSVVVAQVPTDQAARMTLESAQRAFNEKNYPFAVARYREFLAKFGGHRDAPQARYGLGLALLESNERDFAKAADEFNTVVGDKNFAERPRALYYLGLSRRGQGTQALQQALAKPAEANGLRDQARQRFEDAARQFALAAEAFTERTKTDKDDKTLSDWLLRSRCDQAEMLLRLKKPKEARAALALLDGDDAKTWQANVFGPQAMYLAGFADFLQGNDTAAGKLLSREVVLNDDLFGTHATYLLARVHHRNTAANERDDARIRYQAVLSGYEAAKKKATDALRTPQSPETKARLESLVKSPPDHVLRATFYLGSMQYEDGRFAEAQEQLAAFVKANPDSPLAAEATLRLGFCQVQTSAWEAALKTLQPLEKHPLLGDQATFWVGKALAGKVDPAKGEKYDAALDAMTRAADRAGDAKKALRGEMLLEKARLLQKAARHREAADTYGTVISANALPERSAELTLERATALQLAGEFSESDRLLGEFTTKYKDSPLSPVALFRRGENSVFVAQKYARDANPAERAKAKPQYEEAIKRYGELVAKFPEAANIGQARQGIGTAYYLLGDLEKAQKAFEAIPPADRSNDLLTVNYQLADIYLRQLPTRADDAVAAGRLEEKLKNAGELLEAFVAGAPDHASAPDALLKLGYCRQRQAALIAKREDQLKLYAEARTIYERIPAKYAKSDALAPAILERAKVIAAMGDANGAMNELRRFSADPLKITRTAPVALLALATLQRAQNKPADAAATLDEARKAHEAGLSGNPATKDLVATLRYHHAAALREAGKLAEARDLFDGVSREFEHLPEGWDAGLRAGQTLKELGEKRLADARKQLTNPGLNPEQRGAAEKAIATGLGEMRQAVDYWTGKENDLRKRKAEGEEATRALSLARSRLLYEAAWGWRALAEMEIESARGKLQQERWQKRRDDLSKGLAPGQPPPQIALPTVALREVPIQNAEKSARQVYENILKSFPDLNIQLDARLELAELLATRDDHAAAIKLLQEALEGDREPAAELLEKIKLRLAACQLDQATRTLLRANAALANKATKPDARTQAEADAKKARETIESAMEQLQAISGNDKSKLWQQAVYREAECLLQLGKSDEAIKLLARFRDDGKFHNLPGLTDRALLRLGAALAEVKQWEPSRAAYQALLERHGSSPWIHEARYGQGWALQNLGRLDDAVNLYGQVTGAVTTELAARAQLNIGLCRMAQKKPTEAATALLVVPFTYDYPEISALALLEAARALHEAKQTPQAIGLLKRLLRDYPTTPAADAARQRLTEWGEV